MIGWLQKVTTTKRYGEEDVKKLSYMVREKSTHLGEVRLYIAKDNYVPERILGKVQTETSYQEGVLITHVWQWEPKE